MFVFTLPCSCIYIYIIKCLPYQKNCICYLHLLNEKKLIWSMATERSILSHVTTNTIALTFPVQKPVRFPKVFFPKV